MKVGIAGTRGIPNNYGGFEQFAEYLAVGLVERGVEVWVYNSHDHPCREKLWKGVNRIHCYDPEGTIGVAGQFLYDLNCIADSRKRNFDILLQLGYTSSSVWHRLLPKGARIITNMDGMEWQRSKYHPLVRRFLKHAEKLAVNSSNLLIADAEPIRDYLDLTYNAHSRYIAYGAEVFETPDPACLQPYQVSPGRYFMVIARMQPDNHIEEVIRGVLRSGSDLPLLVVGNVKNGHGAMLVKKYASDQVRFLGGIFRKEDLNQLRHFSRLYFHGHSAGGTNPSLLEAMAAGAPVCAHDNPFNRSVLGDDASFFADEGQLAALISSPGEEMNRDLMKWNNMEKIKMKYSWNSIIDEYFRAFADELGKSTV